MRVNVNKMASCANFFNMCSFTYKRNKFFEAYIIHLYVNIITKSKMILLTATKSLRKKVQHWYEGKAYLWDRRADHNLWFACCLVKMFCIFTQTYVLKRLTGEFLFCAKLLLINIGDHDRQIHEIYFKRCNDKAKVLS